VGGLVIRTARGGDAGAFAEIYAPIVRDTFISFETEPPDAEEMARRIAGTLPTHPWLTAERDGEVLGYAYAGAHRARAAYRWSADVTVYLAASARRAGVGRALYGELISILKRQRLRSAFAGIALPNDASVGLHEAMGFEPLGVYRDVGFKLGGWRDVGWWRLTLDATTAPPDEPIPFGQLGVLG
jgi:L-amino acid N-acyltransferase YncA